MIIRAIRMARRGLYGLGLIMLSAAIQAEDYKGIEEVVVTAEKRTSTVQDTAIAVSAFNAEALDNRQIANTSDLQFSVPNMMFGKGNFEGSNISIRGVGNLAVADSSDNSVGIHVNDIYLNEPRIFEIEFFDVERIEVLRGPQGTLYGRNTTGGVLNMITAKPVDALEADLSVGVGDYNERKVSGMINMPVSDAIATRLAGYYLKRDGYTDNLYTGNSIDDRDLFSVRWTTSFEFSDSTYASFMASYYEEDDARSRVTKQLCTKDVRGAFGTGCLPGSRGYGVPHSESYISAALDGMLNANAAFSAATGGPARPALGPPTGPDSAAALTWIYGLGNGAALGLPPSAGDAYVALGMSGVTSDFYANSYNPPDLREVYADFDPEFYADETLVSFEITHDFDNMSLNSITAWHDGEIAAFTDFDWAVPSTNYLEPVTYYLDGNRTRVANFSQGVDRAQAETSQWSEQITLVTDNDGKLNWTGGAYYMEFEKRSHYNVYSSGLTAWAAAGGLVSIIDAILGLPQNTYGAPLPKEQAQFDSYTRYDVTTWALFGEMYYDFTDDTRLTVGLRYSDETKEVHAIQYYVDLASAVGDPLSNQENDWQEVTGKITLDHNLYLGFTDEAMVYGTVARGYKGGGFNPPVGDAGATYPETFDPEYINSLEVGIKSQMLDNTLQANVSAFVYDYSGLQVSQIVAQTGINENTDADIWGIESEFMYAPQNWLFGLNVAYLNAEVGDFQSIDSADPAQLKGANGYINVFGNLAGPDPVAVDLEGNDLVGSPKYSVNLFAEYYLPMSNGMSMLFHLDYFYQDEFYARNFNNPADLIDSWDLSNAFVSLTNAADTWTLKAWVKNIQDDDNITGYYTSDANTGLFSNTFVLEPRTYGVTFTMRMR